MRFEVRNPADNVFRRYVQLTECIDSVRSLGTYDAADRCRHCGVGERVEVRCDYCGKPWKPKSQAFTRCDIQRDTESPFLKNIDEWRSVKHLVEPTPHDVDLWFWCFCVRVTCAYVDVGIGTVANVVRWGQVYWPVVEWSPGVVRDAVICARVAVSERMRCR